LALFEVRRTFMAEANIWVETVELDSAGTRQIKQRSRTTALLRDRADDIESAVQEASAIIQRSVAKVQDQDDWHMKSVEAKFGLVITAAAGVVVSRASAEASFEVTLTIERR
jgi:Trypsin-co-occurring domain 1